MSTERRRRPTGEQAPKAGAGAVGTAPAPAPAGRPQQQAQPGRQQTPAGRPQAPHPTGRGVVGPPVQPYEPSRSPDTRRAATRPIPAMRPSRHARRTSQTPIYDALYAEYRRLFRALPGDRTGEEGLRFENFGTVHGTGSWADTGWERVGFLPSSAPAAPAPGPAPAPSRRAAAEPASPPALPPAPGDGHRRGL